MPPRFIVVQRASALAVAALGFAALWISGELNGALLWGVGMVMAAAAWEGRPRLTPGTWLVIQVGFLVWLAAGQLLWGRPLLTSFGALLVFVQVHRLLSRSTARDDLYSYFIAFGQLLLASVLTVDAGFLVVFVLFLVSLVWAMLMTRLALAVERDSGHRHPHRLPDRRAWEALGTLVRWPVFLVVSVLVLGLLAGTMGLFFVLPRMEASFLGAGLLPPVHVSGFSERVGLGEIGVLQLSDAPVMRARLFDPNGAPVDGSKVYWRGLALDRFDGRTWSLSDPDKTDLAWVGGAKSRGPPRRTAWTVRQEVALEPLDSRVLFHVADAAGIYGDFRSLQAAPTDGFFVPGIRRRMNYTVYSAPPKVDLAQLREIDPTTSRRALLEVYTQLPSDLAPRIAEMAAEWTRGASTAVDAALLVQGHLRENFVYSLAQPASGSADPLLAFLDEVQEGHCEYFASSMVVMLRTMGIPTRIVNGFQSDEYNPVGKYWLIRQRHAHSWVEVHFPGEGWIIFDPTPLAVGGVGGRARIRWLARAQAWIDVGRVRWADVMLDYGLDNQAEGVRAALSFLQGEGFNLDLSWFGGPSSPRVSEQPAGPGLPWAALLALLGGGGLLWVLSAPRRGRGRLEGTRSLRRAQALMTRLRARWERSSRRAPDPPEDGATLRDWAHWAAREHGLTAAPEVVDRYYASRFGSAPVPPDLVPQLKDLLRESPRAIRR
jgi:transglutaminase-like putative cysteine protease